MRRRGLLNGGFSRKTALRKRIPYRENAPWGKGGQAFSHGAFFGNRTERRTGGEALFLLRGLCFCFFLFQAAQPAGSGQNDKGGGDKRQNGRAGHGDQHPEEGVLHTEPHAEQLGQQDCQRDRQNHFPQKGQQRGFHRTAQGLQEDKGRFVHAVQDHHAQINAEGVLGKGMPRI